MGDSKDISQDLMDDFDELLSLTLFHEVGLGKPSPPTMLIRTTALPSYKSDKYVVGITDFRKHVNGSQMYPEAVGMSQMVGMKSRD